jgi:hypothetical protein
MDTGGDIREGDADMNILMNIGEHECFKGKGRLVRQAMLKCGICIIGEEPS